MFLGNTSRLSTRYSDLLYLSFLFHDLLLKLINLSSFDSILIMLEDFLEIIYQFLTAKGVVFKDKR